MKLQISYLLVLGSIVIASCSGNRKQSCEDFKNGKFSIHSEITGTNFMIHRNDSLQIQTEKETGRTSEWRIRWLNDCEYSISLLRDNYGLVKSYETKDLPTINYKIIKSAKDHYIFLATFTPGELKLSDTIWKLE
jgi:hypothetical protein